MPTTRSSDKAESGAKQAPATGEKHQIEKKTSPAAKRPKKVPDETPKKTQKTLEDTMPSPTQAYGNGIAKDTKPKREPKEKKQETATAQPDEGAAEEEGARAGQVPASILEKGLIYFFFRGRVGIDEPSDVNEIARTYFVLRPLHKDAKLGEGTISDAGNSRLMAVPKKVFPLSGRDRWIAFVEKSDASFKTLKEEFISASDYTTKTAGVRHTPAATPAAEGIYAITTTGRESHLAYMITLPSELGEVQSELGLREKGSFILSTRNPSYEAPKGTALPQGPDYPKEVLEEFRALRWMPTQPKHLDYVNTQFLLVGESSGIQKATEPQKDDEKEGKEKPLEELEKLEDEDTHRMEHLKGDDSTAIFADLGAQAEDYPKIQTTF
ncbi:hypothetical protein F4778DRAFT_724447 [Xylariomycetidae sp. FL2044]|nr:hypothetical protein F4778DRAFT_724447 [Xylariomycetidae sp. FL2044]